MTEVLSCAGCGGHLSTVTKDILKCDYCGALNKITDIVKSEKKPLSSDEIYRFDEPHLIQISNTTETDLPVTLFGMKNQVLPNFGNPEGIEITGILEPYEFLVRMTAREPIKIGLLRFQTENTKQLNGIIDIRKNDKPINIIRLILDPYQLQQCICEVKKLVTIDMQTTMVFQLKAKTNIVIHLFPLKSKSNLL